MKTLVLTAYIFIITIPGIAQNIRWTEGQPLTWEDFTGKVNDSSKFDAECYAEIRYEYRFFSTYRFEFQVYANFDKNSSWRKRENQTDELLRHEQMHFDIAELFAMKLKEDFENCIYTANYNDQILFLFDKRKQEYQSMQKLYDDETNHSLNKEKQKDWENTITNELRKLKLDLQIVEISKQSTREGI